MSITIQKPTNTPTSIFATVFFLFSTLPGLIPFAHSAEAQVDLINVPDKSILFDCNKTPDGYRVRRVQSSITTRLTKMLNDPPGLIYTPIEGDRCLPFLASIQKPFRSKLLYRTNNTTAGGFETTIDECLIWVFIGMGVGEQQAVACDVGEDDILRTEFVDNAHDYTLEPDTLCVDTLTTLADKGYHRRGAPMTAVLGQAESGNPRGGLAWSIFDPGKTMQIIECNRTETKNLVVT